jgi:hypothetical protein
MKLGNWQIVWAAKSIEMRKKGGTQPVLLQSLHDKFDLPEGKNLNTPAIPGSILLKGEPENNVSNDEQTTYRSCMGKLLHMMKWSRPDILNSARELSRFMTGQMGPI